MATYTALVGIDYPPNKRIEAGQTVSDLPGSSAKWLLAEGYIEPVGAAAPTDPAPVDEPVV